MNTVTSNRFLRYAAAAAAVLSLAVLPAASASALTGTSSQAGTISGAAPAAWNTGVPDRAALNVYWGDYYADRAGQVISNMDIRGNVVVKAPNVTIRNTIIRSRPMSTTTNTGLINAMSPLVKNLNISDTTIIPSEPKVYLTGIYGHDFVLDRVEIANVVDGVHVTGSEAKITSSWIHDLSHFAVDPYQNYGPSHDDGIQIIAGANVWVANNVISGASNAAIQVTQGGGAVSNLYIENNQLSGGQCTVNISQKMSGKTSATSAPLYGTVIRNNVFGSSLLTLPERGGLNCNMIIESPTLKLTSIYGNQRTDWKPLAFKDSFVY